MAEQLPSKERDWRAGCECNRVGLCFRCQAATQIERLQLQVYALTNANKSLAEHAAGQPPNRHTARGPSKDLVERLRWKWADHGSGYNSEHTADLMAAADEIERLRTCLTGIASCSTCEVCRGAATLALGGDSGLNVAPIAKLTVRDGLVQRAGLYAPGLPDGEHDLFPVPLNPAGELQRSESAQPPRAEPPDWCPTCQQAYDRCACNGGKGLPR